MIISRVKSFQIFSWRFLMSAKSGGLGNVIFDGIFVVNLVPGPCVRVAIALRPSQFLSLLYFI